MRLAFASFAFVVVGFVLVARAADPPKTWRFTTGATPEITVENVAGSIVVEGGASEVRVEALGDNLNDWIVEAQGDANGVRVKARCKDHSCRSSVALRLKAPAGSRLSLHGVSSDVTATGIKGAQKIQTTSGDVKVSGAGGLSLKTVSGDVKVDGASGVTAESVSGDLMLQAAGAQIKAHTVSGDVQWNGTCGAGCRLEVNTVSGDLMVRAAAASSFQVDFQTRSGDFTDGLGTGASGGRDGVRTRVGKGEGSVSFKSVSGDLRLQRM
jgi:hypothetical protein